jgi:CxxC motif-containing protein (DUF1111 family)
MPQWPSLKFNRLASFCLGFVLAVHLLASSAGKPVHDPGPRAGAAAAGGPLETVSVFEKRFYLAGRSSFEETVSVTGSLPDTEKGLGPRFNLDSCAGCHAFPALGGSSPAVNPQIEAAKKEGATNRIPWFVSPHGPVRAARFKLSPDGAEDGHVHPLFTIYGRSDAPKDKCKIEQPDFDAKRSNLAFRIPTPLFGLGLVEVVPDQEILENLRAHGREKQMLKIGGRVSRNANDGSINRFGWKAQNRSILMFVGESYNVEMGVSNDLFPSESGEASGCELQGNPEDEVSYAASVRDAAAPDILRLASFVRFLAPPLPAPQFPAAVNGSQLFGSVGCAFCHTPKWTTGVSASQTLSHKNFAPYSDFSLHHMGARLADGIWQGDAAGDEFRTAPLWGLGQRIFFLHDGRTSDLLEAIKWHADSPASQPRSEADEVIRRFLLLSPSDQQDVLEFLRSL